MEYSFDHRRNMSISPVNSDEFAGEIAVDARELLKFFGLRTARKGDLGRERQWVRALQGARREKFRCQSESCGACAMEWESGGGKR